MKEQQILSNKLRREKIRELKEKEQGIQKEFKGKKIQLINEIKTINSELREQKLKTKSESNTEKKILSQD